MINKLLCFMWGHVPEAVLAQNFIFVVINGVYNYSGRNGLIVIKKCKRCKDHIK